MQVQLDKGLMRRFLSRRPVEHAMAEGELRSRLEEQLLAEKTPWHYGTVRMGGKQVATRFHPGQDDTEFWEAGEWKEYSIAELQRRAGVGETVWWQYLGAGDRPLWQDYLKSIEWGQAGVSSTRIHPGDTVFGDFKFTVE